GGVIVRRYGVVVGEFPMLTPRTAIGSWAVAFEAGHTLGQKSGIEQGRTQLAAEMRTLLGIETA
ncbi:MAG: hypothetical protein KGH75_04960, partial [Rhodospirillales bacterium]|nr:hypothetical protein [Rhodospirillales bacterium]